MHREGASDHPGRQPGRAGGQEAVEGGLGSVLKVPAARYYSIEVAENAVFSFWKCDFVKKTLKKEEKKAEKDNL